MDRNIKQDNGFSVYLGLAQTFGAYQPHPPQRARWGTFPKGEGMGAAAPAQLTKINDHLLLYPMFFNHPEAIPSFVFGAPGFAFREWKVIVSGAFGIIVHSAG